MKTLHCMLATAALGAMAAGAALAQGAGPVQPAPPADNPAAAIVNDGLTRSVNATSLKAVFEAAKVPVEMHTTEKGYTYLSGTPQGYTIFVYPMDCEGGDSLKGACKAVAIESGLWNLALGAEKANLYNRGATLGNAVIYDGNQDKPVLEYTFAVDSGVSGEYVRTALRYFTYNLQHFQQFLEEQKAAGSSSQPSSGFATAKPSAGLASATRRVGAPETDAVIGGNAFGP